MISVKENVDLLPYNTFRVPARARYFAEVENISDVRELLTSSYCSKPFFVLGGGSNVLFTADFEGLIARILIKGIEIIHEDKKYVIVKAGAGENWDSFVEYCVSNDWGGIENLSWIPGMVGASPVQNIGAYGVEVMDFIHSVEGFRIDTGKHFSLSAAECHFSYRNSIFKNELKNSTLITHVQYTLSKEHTFNTGYPDLRKKMDDYDETSIQNIRLAIIDIRKNKLPDPDTTGNAGSFFKNPVVIAEKAESIKKSHPDLPVYAQPDGRIKLSAAWLIDKSGWKGKTIGNAATHKNQPLIIINRGQASGEEIRDFARKVQHAVVNQFGVLLDTEVNIL